MSIAKSHNTDCQEEVCEVNFRPTRTSKNTFENLKSIAGNLIEKIKETISGDNHDAVQEEAADQTVDDQPVVKKQINTVRDKAVFIDEEDNQCIGRHSTEILSRFVQESWRPLSRQGQAPSSPEQIRLRADESMVKAPRFSNPWRYDSHHQA